MEGLVSDKGALVLTRWPLGSCQREVAGKMKDHVQEKLDETHQVSVPGEPG